jgi:ATP-dependent DNA helicase DinG
VLKKRFGESAVLVQGEKPVKSLIALHQKRIDGGEGSVLVGLDTLAEGLDLPGNYCSHVVTSGLPFSVPTSALERELQKRLGDRYFEMHALPEATRKLIQATGRLVRRESDIGRITVLDPRLLNTGYGRRMLKSLPPFTVIRS